MRTRDHHTSQIRSIANRSYPEYPKTPGRSDSNILAQRRVA
jgi:hypothetical protein